MDNVRRGASEGPEEAGQIPRGSAAPALLSPEQRQLRVLFFKLSQTLF